MRNASIVFAFIFAFSFLAWGTTRTVKAILFHKNCQGYLKQAADANVIPLAKERLEIGVKYLTDYQLTKGFTSVIYTTPDEDVGFWYSNLTKALQDLDNVPEDATQLEQSNVLMKLRETLLDDSSSGVSVTVPSGISVFPYNGLYALWGVLSFLLTAIFAFVGFSDL